MGIGNIATTGMQAAMTNMEVISNNIANSNTPGFKSSYTNFADLYPVGNASSVQAGLGVAVTSIQQNFTSGGPTPTMRQDDFAINNDGFFIMRDTTTGQTSYTRYGRFDFNQGYFMIGNQRLQGFPAVNNAIPSGSTPGDLYVNTASIPAKATTTVTQQQLNLNAGDNPPTNPVFNPTDSTSYNFSSTANVYDSLGNKNEVTLYYIKTSANNWTVNAYVNGASIGTGSLAFNGSNGQLSSSTGLSSLSFSPTSGASSPQTFSISMTGATQYSKPYNANEFTSDGYQAGNYVNYQVDKNGLVTVLYDNNQSVTAGQIALAQFQSPQGLQDIGNMSWIATSESGNPFVNQSNSQNSIQQSALEMSNVDLATEMVNLVSAQNIFQANAQVEQTYNQVMQTVTQL